MQLPPFESPKLLIAGARESIERVEALGEEFIKADRPELVYESDRRAGLRVAKLKFGGQFPLKLRLEAYRVVNELRNALDQAMCDSARICGLENVRQVHFPMGREPADLAREIARRCKGVHADLVAHVESLQPHQTGNPVLWALGKMAGPNKHQHVLAVGRGGNLIIDPGVIKIHGEGVQIPIRGGWNPNRNELTVLTAPLESGAEFNFRIAPIVVLGDVEIFEEKAAGASFHRLADLVETVVTGLEAKAYEIVEKQK